MFLVTATDGTDHCACLLDPFAAHAATPERPFTFHRARRIEPGHEA